MTPKFLEHIVILCLERRYPKQNSVIRLKSNILPNPNFWAGYIASVYVSVALPKVTSWIRPCLSLNKC